MCLIARALDELDQMLDRLEVLAEGDVLVGFMRLGDRARAENHGRDAALVNEMAHVAAERAGTRLPLSAATRQDIAEMARERNLRALARAVVVMQELEPGRVAA